MLPQVLTIQPVNKLDAGGRDHARQALHSHDQRDDFSLFPACWFYLGSQRVSIAARWYGPTLTL